MGRKGIKLLRRMAPEDIAAGFKSYCETDRQDLLPAIPSRLRSMERAIIKIRHRMGESPEPVTDKEKGC
jgi:hypothetical protein